MKQETVPSLTLGGVAYRGRETPMDLRSLLYAGGAGSNARAVPDLIEDNALGAPIRTRLPFVLQLHEVFQGFVAAGNSLDSIRTWFEGLRAFYKYIDEVHPGTSPTEQNAAQLLVAYARHVRTLPHMTATSRHARIGRACRCVAPILGISTKALVVKTGSRPPRKLPGMSPGDKADLQEIFSFMQVLRAAADQLTLEVIQGPLPVKLLLPGGKVHAPYCGLVKPLQESALDRSNQSVFRRARAKYSEDDDLGSRHRTALVSFRVEAELLMFIQQTGANLSQASSQLNIPWRYQSRDEYVEMWALKERAAKEVGFRVYAEYRPFFETYRSWRNSVFGDDEAALLFKLPARSGGWGQVKAFWNIRSMCRAIGKPFIGPQILRNSAGNWMESKRQGMGPVFLSNSKSVFDFNYRQHGYRKTLVEVTRFFRGIRSSLTQAVGPVGCQSGTPLPQAQMPKGAPLPDCHTPGACLFCESSRDIESFDHVWQLASYRALAIREVAADSTALERQADHPRGQEIKRIGEKMVAFMSLGREWPAWIHEAERRVAAEDYHPLFVEHWIVAGHGDVDERAGLGE